MRWSLDPRSPESPSEQLADQVRFAVAAGRLAAGERLPSVRALAAEVRVNPNTVSRAWRELEREGVLAARRGEGMFVAPGAARVARAACEDAIRARVERAVGQAAAAGLDAQRVFEWVRAALAARDGEREAS